jgi:hypothetical protein
MRVSAVLRIPVLVLVVAALAWPTFGEVPDAIQYQGRLTNSDGEPIDGAKLIKFKIYGSATGNDSLWSSGFQAVQVSGGLFTYELGSHIPLPDDLFLGSAPRYLGITVDIDKELEPRAQFLSMPYTIHSLMADSLTDAPYVKKTGDTISGHMYFDDNGLGKEAELLLYNGISILNMYEASSKRITLESEFATVVLRGEDGDISLWLSGGEESTEGGTITFYNSDGVAKMKLDGGRTGDVSAILQADAINSDELLNEPGIAYNGITNYLELTASTMTDLVTVSVSIPAAGYVHVTGKAIIRRSVPGPTDACYCGSYLQIDETAGGSFYNPYASFVNSWLEVSEEAALYASRTFYKSSAGTYEFRLEANRESSSEDCGVVAWNRSITAVYYPTSYEVTK